MTGFEPASARCPYCGAAIRLLIDPDNLGEACIEDCSVCCRPITITARRAVDGTMVADVRHEND